MQGYGCDHSIVISVHRSDHKLLYLLDHGVKNPFSFVKFEDLYGLGCGTFVNSRGKNMAIWGAFCSGIASTAGVVFGYTEAYGSGVGLSAD